MKFNFDLPGLSIETLSRSGPIMTWYRPTNKHTKISKKKTECIPILVKETTHCQVVQLGTRLSVCQAIFAQ